MNALSPTGFTGTNARPSARAMITERRTYLRPLDEDGLLFETSRQMLDRVISHQRWLWENQIGRQLNWREEDELLELLLLMQTSKVSMSGRVKWMGGTELVKERASAAFNCLGRETRFVTNKGVKSFEDFTDGDKVTVWTHKGRWMPAVVRSYGEQRLNKITFGRTKAEVEVRATANHRWLLDNGRGETTALAERDRIRRPVSDFADWDFDGADIDEQMWWAYGYVYGDGTITKKNGKPTGSMARLCGKDKALYLDRFIGLGFGYSFPPSCNEDPMVYTGAYKKTLPTGDDDPRMIRAFVRGYLDADGCRANGFNSVYGRILATSEEAKNFIREFFPVAGVFISSERVAVQETNFGTRSNEAVWFNIFDTCGESTNSSYVTRQIEEDAFETVWCLEVEEDHSFTLDTGIVTGNCSFTNVLTPADLVDVFWLLLQGCGVGFKPIPGLMTGFSTNLKTVEIVPSTRKDKGGEENNAETYDANTGVWTIVVGDSAKAWAKALGKIMSGKYPAHTLRIVLTELRPGGKRLKGYGWLSSGWEPLARALEKIGKIMIEAAGRILTAIEIGDIVNLLGTVLSSRRSAQIWLLDDTSSELEEFIDVKVGRYENGKEHREQSNNSILFWSKPTRSTVIDLLTRILAGGDPAFINAREARRRAPDFEGGNPCAEILLPSKGFCNLVQVVWHRFNGDLEGLMRAQYLAGRANYRQTCVSMRDGVLQLGWNDNQHLLRLCGVAPLGYVSWEGMNNPEMLEMVRDAAIRGADSMADQFGTPRSRRVTQVQPGGTSSKHLGLEGDEVHEGAHLALSRWIFNNINVSRREPLVDLLRAANYHITPNPIDPEAVLVRIPVEYPDSPLWTKKKMVIGGREEEVEINTESAISQLERYRMLMQHYVQHNCSITVSFDETEIEEMADWFMKHWDSYVGISFLRRNDPTKTAADLGFSYLPQETVSRQMYEAYVSTLLPVDLSGDTSMDMLDDLTSCGVGSSSCPIR